MKLTIDNINKIINTKIDTANAQWVIEYVMSNEEYYTIKVTFVFGKTFGKKHPNHIYFQLYRDKTNDGYWIMDSTEKALHRWGLYKAHMETSKDFIDTLKQQLQNI